jgi:hypothetical protein
LILTIFAIGVCVNSIDLKPASLGF